MKLSEVPKDQLKSGMKVIGANGVPGIVCHIQPNEGKFIGEDDWNISIDWDNGNQSWIWHFWTNYIEVTD